MQMQNDSQSGKTEHFSAMRPLTFFLLLAGLIAGATLRSSIATRFDGFTLDEGFHIGAGAAYVQTADFRLNPEHPPLVKLWAGAFVSDVYQLSPYRTLGDRNDERNFVEEDVYVRNDPDVIQSRARTAMFTLNAILLLLFATAVRRVFGDIPALATTAFLAIDPTIAAHLPVVMTDLPVALLSVTAVLLAVVAFLSWRKLDLLFAAIALGLAMSAKHSAVLTMGAVAVIGIVMALLASRPLRPAVRVRRVALVSAVILGAMVVLWSFYLFRFHESPATSEEQFNRPLAGKISDVRSPLYRAGLQVMAQGHLFPRAYTWGMADTIRAGAEGRARSVFAFGRKYEIAPFYFFPGVLAVKLPLGLLVLTLLGAGLVIARKVRREFLIPIVAATGFALLFLKVLSTGSSYAGIRHALPVVPVMALLGSLAMSEAVRSQSRLLRSIVLVSLLGALISAIPVVRPWEYYNETVGGSGKAYLLFNDEGIDISLRTKDLTRYYNDHLRASGEIPYIVYPMREPERRGRRLDWVGKDLERDKKKVDNEVLSGTIFVGARQVRGKDAFRQATPVARLGNLFIFRGAFADRDTKILRLVNRAMKKIYSAEPDTEGAIQLLSQAVALDPKKFTNALELGNQYLKVGKRDEALKAYRIAREHAPSTDHGVRALLTSQITRVNAEPLAQIPPLRNPKIE